MDQDVLEVSTGLTFVEIQSMCMMALFSLASNLLISSYSYGISVTDKRQKLYLLMRNYPPKNPKTPKPHEMVFDDARCKNQYMNKVLMPSLLQLNCSYQALDFIRNTLRLVYSHACISSMAPMSLPFVRSGLETGKCKFVKVQLKSRFQQKSVDFDKI